MDLQTSKGFFPNVNMPYLTPFSPSHPSPVQVPWTLTHTFPLTLRFTSLLRQIRVFHFPSPLRLTRATMRSRYLSQSSSSCFMGNPQGWHPQETAGFRPFLCGPKWSRLLPAPYRWQLVTPLPTGTGSPPSLSRSPRCTVRYQHAELYVFFLCCVHGISLLTSMYTSSDCSQVLVPCQHILTPRHSEFSGF